MNFVDLEKRLKHALEARLEDLQSDHQAAFRVFNGYLEGIPGLVIEVFASALVISDSSEDGSSNSEYLWIFNFYFKQLNWLNAGVLKKRNSTDPDLRNGKLIFGTQLPDQIYENRVGYSIDLTFQQDNSFYLDTRLLRKWLKEHSQGWSVLNTFAYTGSLGIACLAGGADQVIQADRNDRFIAVARKSASLNGFTTENKDYLAEDFFSTASRFRHSKKLFDCVILDPPYFSQTPQATIDLENQFSRLLNKVRPLIADGGVMIAINNSLFVSGKDFMEELEKLSLGGFVKIEETIPVPPDCTGYPATIISKPIVDPSPFNHSTKIAILRIKRK